MEKKTSHINTQDIYMDMECNLENNILKRDITEIIYCCCAFIYILLQFATNILSVSFLGISISTWNRITSYLIPIILILVFIISLFENYINIKRLCLYLLLIIILTLVYFTSRYTVLIATFTFIISYPRGLSLNRLAKYVSIACFIGILLVVVQYLMGLIPELVQTRSSGRERHSLGFASPNALSNAVTYAFIPYVYWNYKTWNPAKSIFLILAGTITFIIADGRYSFIILLTLLLFVIISRHSKGVSKILCVLAPFAILIGYILSTILLLYFDNNTMSESYTSLNTVVSGRLNYSINYYDVYGIHLFGQQIETTSIRDTYFDPSLSWSGIDASYINSLIRFGIILSVLIAAFYYYLGYRANTIHDISTAILILTIALFALTENCLYNTSYNFTIFILAEELNIFIKSVHSINIRDKRNQNIKLGKKLLDG